MRNVTALQIVGGSLVHSLSLRIFSTACIFRINFWLLECKGVIFLTKIELALMRKCQALKI